MRMRNITFKIDPVLLEKLDEWAWELRVTRSEMLRRAVIRLLSELASEHPFAHYKIVKRHRKTRAITVIV